MSDEPHDLSSIHYDVRFSSLDGNGKGEAAKREYFRLLNQQRSQTDLYLPPDPCLIALDKETPAKWAVLRVLSTNVALSIKDIRKNLQSLKYGRRDSVLRSSLKRIVEFGLATRYSRYRSCRTSWRLTEKGRQLPLVPVKRKNPMHIQTKIEESLKTKTSWVFALDLATELQLKPSVVSGALRKLYAKAKTVRQLHPGCQARLWALKSTYDQALLGLDLPSAPPKTAPRKKKTVSASAVATPPTKYWSQPMCLPNKPTLVQAVTLIVDEKVSAKESFSSYDITKALRERVLNKAEAFAKNLTTKIDATALIDTTETGTVHVGGLDVAKIEHENVREVVRHLFSTGAMENYGCDSSRPYLEYKAPTVAADPDPSPRVSVATSDPYDGSSTI